MIQASKLERRILRYLMTDLCPWFTSTNPPATVATATGKVGVSASPSTR